MDGGKMGKMTNQRLRELTKKAESGVKMSIPQAYDMLELIDELNHVHGQLFECRRSMERIYDSAKDALAGVGGCPSPWGGSLTGAADSRAAECKHILDFDGICKACGADRRGI